MVSFRINIFKMKTETQIAEENVKLKEEGIIGLPNFESWRTHKATCQRFLEFLEDIQLNKSEDKMEKEHLKIGKSDNSCEFCGKLDWEGEEPLTNDIDNCEVYLHKNCYERAKMIVELFEESYKDLPKEDNKKSSPIQKKITDLKQAIKLYEDAGIK